MNTTITKLALLALLAPLALTGCADGGPEAGESPSIGTIAAGAEGDAALTTIIANATDGDTVHLQPIAYEGDLTIDK